jgi:hypothetical protein
MTGELAAGCTTLHACGRIKTDGAARAAASESVGSVGGASDANH